MSFGNVMQGLRTYQVEGVDFLAQRRAGLLAFQQRLGKTPTAIRACNAVGAMRVNVVCPAIGVSMWQREFPKWSLLPAELRVASFDKAVRGALGTRPADVLIVDECQKAKNAQTQRTEAIYGPAAMGGGLASRAGRVWLLSGTPTPNGAHELYPHLRALWPELIKHPSLPRPMLQHEFEDLYCHVHVKNHRRMIRGTKAAMRPAIREMLQQIALRKRLVDVRADMPPIQFEYLPISGRKLSVNGPSSADIEAAIEAMEEGRTPQKSPSMAQLLREAGAAKVDAAIELIADRVVQSGPTLAFCHHIDGVLLPLVAGLKKAGLRVVTIHGSVSEAQRIAAQKAFQEDGTADVLVGNILACGTSIPLHRATNVVFVECAWVPADNEQALFRAISLDKSQGLLVTFLTLQGSLDEAVVGALSRKTREIGQLWQESGA